MTSRCDRQPGVVRWGNRRHCEGDLGMHAFRFGRPFMERFALSAAFIATGALAIAGLNGFQQASAESGSLEVSQEFLLLVSFGLYAWAGLRHRTCGRMTSFAATTLAGVFFLRELELPVGGAIGAYMTSAMFRWHEAVVIAAIAGPYILLRGRLVPCIVSHFCSQHMVPYLLVLVFLLLGDFLEGNRLGDPLLSTFFEELSETLAYVVLASTGLQVAFFRPPTKRVRSSVRQTPLNELRACRSATATDRTSISL